MVFVFLVAILSVSVTAAAPIRWSKELDKEAAGMTEGRTKLERMARVQSSLEKSAALWKLTSTQFPGDAQYVLELEAAAEEMNKLLSAQCMLKNVDEAGCNKHREDAREWLKKPVYEGVSAASIAGVNHSKLCWAQSVFAKIKRDQPEVFANQKPECQPEQAGSLIEASNPNNPDNGQQ